MTKMLLYLSPTADKNVALSAKEFKCCLKKDKNIKKIKATLVNKKVFVVW